MDGIRWRIIPKLTVFIIRSVHFSSFCHRIHIEKRSYIWTSSKCIWYSKVNNIEWVQRCIATQSAPFYDNNRIRQSTRFSTGVFTQRYSLRDDPKQDITMNDSMYRSRDGFPSARRNGLSPCHHAGNSPHLVTRQNQ